MHRTDLSGKRRRRFTILAVLVLFAAGCSGPKQPPRYLDEGEHHLIRLERASDSTRYDHPSEIDLDTLRGALGSLTARHEVSMLNRILAQQKEQKKPAFTPEETALLSERLKEALAKALPEERVAFFLESRKSSLANEVTSGVAFVKEKELYLLLANDHTAVSGEHHSFVSKENPLHPYGPGDFELILRPHQRKVSEGIGRGVQGVAIDFAALSAEPAPAPLPDGEKGEVGSDLSGGDLPESMRLEGRLRLLKKWKEAGLITEEEYANKKAELLKSLDLK